MRRGHYGLRKTRKTAINIYLLLLVKRITQASADVIIVKCGLISEGGEKQH